MLLKFYNLKTFFWKLLQSYFIFYKNKIIVLSRYMFKELISELKTFINKIIKKINEATIERNSKISFKDIFFCALQMNGRNYTYSYVNIFLKSKNIIDVSYESLKKKRQNINADFFKTVNDELLKFIYKDVNKRIIAADATYIPISIKFKDYGFHVPENGTYCIALVSTLFDIERELIINYNLCNHHDERLALKGQFSYLNEGDTLIMDRGYYSEELLYELNKMKINVIFRLKISYTPVKTMIKSNSDKKNAYSEITYNDTKIKLRVVNYTINDKEYYLGTNIYDYYFKYFKNLYWGRWKIEIHFKYTKYYLNLQHLQSTNYNCLLQDIYCHQFIFIINSYFQYRLQQKVKGEMKINNADMLKFINEEFMYYLFYDNFTDNVNNYLNQFFEMFLKQTIPINPNREYPRINIGYITKWKKHNFKVFNKNKK